MSHFREPQDFYNILYQSHIKKLWGEQSPIEINLMKRNREYWKQNTDEWFSHNFLDSWYMTSATYKNTPDDNMRLLLQYDQFCRHPSSITEDAQYEKYKKLNFKFATNLALQLIHNSQYTELEIHEKIFTLLAIRHNDSLTLKEFMLKKVQQELEMCLKTEVSQWMRFLRATILDIDSWKIKNNLFQKEQITEPQHALLLDAMNVIQPPIYNSDNLPADEVVTIREKMLKKMETLILTYYNPEINTIAVSISGGVDSMVVSSIANEVCKRHNIDMILLHICYNNRDCVKKEVSLLKYWATIMSVPLYIRNIDEIKRSRNSQMRTLYEDVTRRIRFSFYKYFECPILLGHNRDDTFENAFSNLAKKIHFDNLKGMTDFTIESNVILLRPFLTMDKEDIIKYADVTKIPHLLDSTPKWCDRGKARDILLPSIRQFDTRILNGLEEFSEYATFLYDQWVASYDNWISSSKNIINSINNREDNSIDIIIVRDEFFHSNYHQLMFWVKLWFDLKLPHRHSNRCIKNLVQQIKTYKDKIDYKIRISLVSNIRMTITERNIIINQE